MRQATSELLTLQNGFPGSAANSAINTYAVNPDYKLPYAQIWDVSSETTITPNLSISLTYTGTKGTNLDMLYALNRPAPGVTTLPFANASNFIYDTSGGNSILNSVQIRLQRRQTRGYGFNMIYTYGVSTDDASDIGGGSTILVQNPDDIRAQYGPSSFLPRNSLQANYYYEPPFGDRHRFAQQGWKAAAFGNWRLSGNIAVTSGLPFTAYAPPSGVNTTGSGGVFAFWADQTCDPTWLRASVSRWHSSTPRAFSAPAADAFGDATRGSIWGPGSFTWNFQVAKYIPFGADRNRRVDLRWEIVNLTNTPNFTGLNTTVGSLTFGRVMGAGAMRTMDIMARINF